MSEKFSLLEVKKSIETKFEDRIYKIREKYDEILTTFYGDYMTPVPPSERVATHVEVF